MLRVQAGGMDGIDPGILGVELDGLFTGWKSSFGSVAELYDRARPGYPRALIDTVLAYANVGHGSRALEIGAGTGQATLQFAVRGLRIDAIEPSLEMAEIARRKFGEHPAGQVTLQNVEFESAQLEPQAFDLIYAATSWHWLRPEARWPIASRAIAPSGSVAVFWNWPRWRESGARDALDAAYEASGADLRMLDPMCERTPDSILLAREWFNEVAMSETFGEAHASTCSWSLRYTADQYVDLLNSHADHIAIEPEVQSRLFRGVRDAINRHGGAITLPYTSLLLLARNGASATATAR